MLTVVIGGGGHARVVIATLQEAGFTLDAVLDDDPAKWNGADLKLYEAAFNSGLARPRGREDEAILGETEARGSSSPRTCPRS